MLTERLCNARLSESRRRREKNDLSIAFSHVVPTAPQEANLFAATDERCQTLCDAGFESTPGPAFANHPPQPRRARNSLEFVQPEVFIVEGGAGERTSQFRDHNRVWRRCGLNPRSQIQCLADSHAF